MKHAYIRYMKKYAHLLLNRKCLLSMFTDAISNGSNTEELSGIFRTEDPEFPFQFADINDENVKIPKNQLPGPVPFDIYDMITIEKGDIDNHHGAPIESTIGRYMLNYIILVDVFGDLISYVNTEWKIGKVESQIASLLLDGSANMPQYNKYMNNGYYIAHFAHLATPTITEKSITTDPNLAKRKKELLQQYAGQLSDPNVIDIIEKELLAIDKAWLQGDDATGFHDGLGGKSWNVHRKKLFVTVGGVEEFSNEGGTYYFIKNSLEEGWEAEDFAALSNETRKASYSRGKETAKGGALTKYILRVFQDVMITEEDCGTKRGIKNSYPEFIMKALIGRHIYDSTGKEVTITEANLPSYVNKPVTLRSPTHCETKDGLCYKCCGSRMKKLGTAAIGPQAVEISSRFMLASMKAMHVSNVELADINPLDFIVLNSNK